MKKFTSFKLPFIGFTFPEALIAVAMLAIMVTAMSPVVFRQVGHHRELSTKVELVEIQRGLMDYRRDVGIFPTERQGLAALVVDPGCEDWNGPYMETAEGRLGDSIHAVSTDAFGESYIYDPDPSTVPRGVIDVLVLSRGMNRRRDLGLDGPLLLSMAGKQDDLIATVSTNFMALAPPRPHGTDRSSVHILSAGLGDQPSGFEPQSGKIGSADTDLSIRNFFRPELSVELRTRLTLNYLQSLLDADPDLHVSPVWSGDNGMRHRFDLGIEFERDGWNRPYHLDTITRRIFSAGSDGNPWTNGDNLPEGVGFW